MKLQIAFCTLLAVALPATLAAQDWTEVDRLTGDIAVELDRDSVAEVLDGAATVKRATFRKQLPNAMMETDVAVDCASETSKIRSIRLMLDGKVATETATPGAAFTPVGYGSVAAIYFKALCGKDIAKPPHEEGAGLDDETDSGDAGEGASGPAPTEAEPEGASE